MPWDIQHEKQDNTAWGGLNRGLPHKISLFLRDLIHNKSSYFFNHLFI
jgi:hypothetical protein